MLTTPANLNLFFTQLETRYWTEYALAEPMWQKISTLMPVGSEVWNSGFMMMIQKYREWIGPRVVQIPSLQTYQVPIKNWENTEGVDKFKFDDDTHGMYSPIAAFMGMQAKKLPDYQIRDALLNQGSWTGVFQNCLDGGTIFGTGQVCGTKAAVPVRLADTYHAFRGQLVSFIDFVRSGRAPYPFVDTVEMMCVIIAGSRSRAEKSRRVEIAEIQAQLPS